MPAYSLTLPLDLSRRLAWVSDSARFNGIHVQGGPGSGKSRVMGRGIGFIDFLRGVPVAIFDPTGGTIDNFIHRLMLLPSAYQAQLWPRVIYVDMSGHDNVVPFPLYYRTSSEESLFTIAQRYLEVVRRMDPALENASVEGWNALYKLGTFTGMVLAGLGLQITAAEDLIRNPQQWRWQFEQLLATYPEAQSAVAFFNELAEIKPEQRLRRAESFLTKILPFSADPRMRAMFGASSPGIDWSQMIAGSYAVLLDFRHELTSERRRFKLLWSYTVLLTCLKQRGFAGRDRPISLIIDEITELVGFRAGGHSVLAQDIEELVSVIARNYGVWLTIAHQSLTQLDPRIQNALLQMGTQMIGVTPNPDDALYLARQFVPYNPHHLKKHEPVWMSVPQVDASGYLLEYSWPQVIDQRAVEYTADEQLRLAAQRFATLKRFEFLVRLASGEGNTSGALQKLSIANLDPGLYPNERMLAQARQRLSQRLGLPIDLLIAELKPRQTPTQPQIRVQSAPPLAILKSEEALTDATTSHDLPITTINPASADSTAAETKIGRAAKEDSFWR